MTPTRMTLALLALLLVQGSVSLAQDNPPAGDPYRAIIGREFGTNAADLAAIEKDIHNSRPEAYPAIEAKLLAVLEAPNATVPARQFACQMLRTVGSVKCIPAVSRLLPDEKLSHAARNVLQGMRDPAAGEALRVALAETQGNLRIGLINTLGDRGDRQSVKALSALAAADQATARAALNALARIGGAEAADALDQVKVADPLKADWAAAQLRCAQSLLAADPARSEKMLQALLAADSPRPVRAAAFTALAIQQKEQAVPAIVKTLASDDRLMARAAATAAVRVPGNAATRAFVAELASLPSDRKPALLAALAARGDANGVSDAVNKLATDADPAVRQAAISALARLGNAASVPLLASALKEGGASANDAARTLADLSAPGIGQALIEQAQAGDPAIREGVLNVLTQRRQADALPAVRKAAGDNDPRVRQAALKALGTLGAQEDVGKLLESLLAARDDGDRSALAAAIASISARETDKAKRAQPVVEALAKAERDAKISLLGILATLGGDQALQAIKASLGGDVEVNKAAVRALADWPDASPMNDLLTIAKNDKDNQILALRGYIRMAGIGRGRGPAKLDAYRQALELAQRPEEKRLALAGLGDVPQAAALKMIEPYLEDASLRREAFVAYEKVAEAVAGNQPAVAREALKLAQEKAPDARTRDRAAAALDRIK